MKPIIITAMHDRPEITRAFCMASQRIKKETGVQTYSVVTRNDRENILLCEEFGLEYIEYSNSPLGAKWNALLRYIAPEDFTHIIVLGSDDIASTSYIEYLIENECDLAGVDELYFWGINPIRAGLGLFMKWRSNLNKILGVGRMVSRRLIEMNDYILWDDQLSMGLDRSMLDRVRPISESTFQFSLGEDLFIMDIKYKKSISSLAPILKTAKILNFKEVLPRFLPDDEIHYLTKIYEKVLY